MKNFGTKVIYLTMIFIISGQCFAVEDPGLGGVAQHLMEPISVFADFIHTSCLLIGGSFLFASIIKYREHRRSPMMVPISTVVFLLIAGICLISLPLLAFYTDYGVTYSLFK